jgi:hypothetical protein
MQHFLIEGATPAEAPTQQPPPIIGTPAAAPATIPQKIGRTLEAGGLGVLQAGTESGQALGQLLNAAINKALGTHLATPQASFFVGQAQPLEHTLAARIGKGIGTVGSAILPGAAVGRLTEGAPLLMRALGYGTAAAATQPGGLAQRGFAGALGGLGGVSDYLLTKAPETLFSGKLAQKILKTYNNQKTVANNLYKNVFDGTENITPQLSNETTNSLNNLLANKIGRAKIIKSIDRYNKNPTLEHLHDLKSDFGKESAKLNLAESSGKSEAVDRDTNVFLKDAGSHINDDLITQLDGINPAKREAYQTAQLHWKENVVPFKQYNSLRKLINTKEITPSTGSAMLRDLSTKSIAGEPMSGAEKLRNLMNLSKTALRVKPFLQKNIRYLGYPLGFGSLYELGRHAGGEL